MLFPISTLAAPVLMFHRLGRRDVALPDLVEALSSCTTDPASIEDRPDWALRRLAPRPRGVRP